MKSSSFGEVRSIIECTNGGKESKKNVFCRSVWEAREGRMMASSGEQDVYIEMPI